MTSSLRLGSDAEFQLARSFLQQINFDDATLCRLLGLGGMSDIGQVNWNLKAGALPQPLGLCVEVFIRGLLVDTAKLADAIGLETMAAMCSLGLLKALLPDTAKSFAPIWLYPADGVLIVSDRHDDPDSGSVSPAEDVVFPAIYGGTLRFLQLLPAANGGDALDLCGGTGIGAFRLARTARSSATSDLTPRSAHFAAFNARLNQLPVESLCGSLYEPVGDRQFDLIAAHPPFVPAVGPTMVYRDAGETGDDVTRGVIEGLPAHLRVGGRCVVLCVSRDTTEQQIEARARGWLGEHAGEFDVVFALEKVLSVDDVVESFKKRGQFGSPEIEQQLRERLAAAATRQFVYGALLIERPAGGCRSKPGRFQMESTATADDFNRLRRLRHARNQPGFNQWLADSQPRLAADLELRARHVVKDGGLVPAEYVFALEGVLPAALRTDGFVVPLIARLDGKNSVRATFAASAALDELPTGFPLEALLDLVGRMLEQGFLEVTLPA